MKKACKLIFVCLSFLIFTANVHSVELLGVDVHGFLSQGYLKSSDYNYHADTDDGTFQFNEVGINFGKDLTEKLHIGMQLFSRDLGKTGNNDITIDWAYADYRWKDWLGFRAGKIKMPQGLYNETRDVDALRTWIFLPASVYPETLRDLNLSLMGAGAYGNVDMGGLGGLSYQALGGTVDVDDDDERLNYHLRAASQNLTDLESTSIDVDWRYALGLVWDTPLDGLRLGGTYNETKLSSDAKIENAGPMGDTTLVNLTEFNYIRNTVASVEYTWNDLLLVAEYITTVYDFEDDNGREVTHTNQRTDGWYLGSSYRLTDWLEIGGYYSEQYNNVDDRDGDSEKEYNPSHRAWLKDVCLTTRFDINEYVSIKLEGHAFEGTDSLFPIDNVPEDGQEWFDDGESWYLLAAKVTYTF
jgi:hypothetical protein